MSRVLALIGAVCLIAAAIVARSVLTGDDGGGDGGDDGGGDAELVVACIPELEDACNAIERPMALSIEDPATTIERLAAGEDIDAWVTFDPWPAMASELEDRAAFDEVVGVAESGLVVVVRDDAIPEGCEPVAWACLVDQLGNKVVVPDPDSAIGRLVVGQAATDFFPGLASNDLRDDVDLQGRLGRLGVDRSGDPAEIDMILLPDPDAAGTTQASFTADVASSPRAGGLSAYPSAAPASVAIVVAGSDVDRITGEPEFTAELRSQGWTIAADAVSTGLPRPGVLIALQGFVG